MSESKSVRRRGAWIVGACLLAGLSAGRQPLAADPPPASAPAPATAPKAGGLLVQSDAVKAIRKTVLEVTFPSHGLTLQGWLYKPKGEGPFPAVVWNHGSEKNPWPYPGLALFYTQHGYVLFLPVRHGHAPSPGDYIEDVLSTYREQNPDPMKVGKRLVELQEQYNEDVVAALDWLKMQPYVDRNRIAVSGASFGGIQTLLTAEKSVGVGVKAFIPFAPAAMAWAGNPELQRRMAEAVRRSTAPIFLIQAENDYNLGPSESLGAILKSKGGLNRSKVYPPFGTTHQQGHGAFAITEDGTKVWGPDVLRFLAEAGVTATPPKAAGK